MNNKFELLSADTVRQDDKTLYRIRALSAFGNVNVGDLGGYIESEKNLAIYEDAWVYDNAQVFGDALISANARVYGEAHVCANAKVSGNAQVFAKAMASGNAQAYGNAKVSGNAEISGDAQAYGNAKVSGIAEVSGDAQVFGDAVVSGIAEVSGDAQVFGDALICANARISGNALVVSHTDYLFVGPAKSSRRFTTAYKDSEIGIRVSCGCFTGTVKEYSDAIENTHAANSEYLEQYRLFAQLIINNFKEST